MQHSTTPPRPLDSEFIRNPLKYSSYVWIAGTDDLTDLGEADQLERLDLIDSYVKSLEPLAKLTNLKDLIISDTEVSCLKPLSSLTNLESLHAERTGIDSIEPLKSLCNLRFLGIEDTNVEDVSPIRFLTALKCINLSNTKVKDLKPLFLHPSLVEAKLSGVHISKNDINMLRDAKNYLTVLYLGNHQLIRTSGGKLRIARAQTEIYFADGGLNEEIGQPLTNARIDRFLKGPQ